MYSRLYRFIIFERLLMKKTNIYCKRYRYLRNKFIDVEIGSISKHMMKIAPEFYTTQVDICGPFNSNSLHHKRTKTKI